MRSAVSRSLVRSLLGGALAWALQTGCTDFQTPAELTASQIIAVVAEPPVVPPGGTSELTLVIAGPDGPVAPTGTTWALAETYPGVAPLGTVVGRSDGTATYTAPAQVPELPPGAAPLDSITVTMRQDDVDRTSLKAIAITDVPERNPVITSITADGVPVDSVTFASGATVQLGVTSDPAPADDWRFAWYASAGAIERFQSVPTAMTAATAGSGFLIVVVRDGTVGAAWRAIPVIVN